MFLSSRSFKQRTTQLFGCLFVSFTTACASSALADEKGATSPVTVLPVVQGSTLTHRSQIDGAFGEVYIYIGGTLPVGTSLLDFQFLFDLLDAGRTTGYITPLLFYRSPGEPFGIYTVVGIGKGFEVSLSSAPQKIPFNLIYGIKSPSSGNFTFGYVNALVNSSGIPLATSAGTVDYDNPGDGGPGVGGPLTKNNWAATAISPSPVVTLGTTFSAGPGSNYTFVTFNSTFVRTYSALVTGTVATQ